MTYSATITRTTRELKPGMRILTEEDRTTTVRSVLLHTDPALMTVTLTNGRTETAMHDTPWTVVLTKAQAEENERQQYADELRSTLAPHQTIYTATEQASSGSSVVHVKLYTAELNDNKRPYIRNITWLAAKATGNTLSALDGIAYGGYGYSRTFQAVYSLGRALFPNGYTCTGSHCRSNDHSNGEPRDGKMHHRDGGYYYLQSSL